MRPLSTIFIACIFVLAIGVSHPVYCQDNAIKRVLFIGNSYTNYYSVPYMVAELARSAGTPIYYDESLIPYYSIQEHLTNEKTLSKIQKGNWDYVILQEQSQRPALSLVKVQNEVFPYVKRINDSIKKYSECSKTMFFMTWGRRDGDAAYCPTVPEVCTYQGMDSLLNLRYRMMADSTEALICPVGAVRKYLRENFPEINLYEEDGSHPSYIGSYVSACCFYTCIFQKDPSKLGTLSVPDSIAFQIKSAVKILVYDKLSEWNFGKYSPQASFDYSYLGNGSYQFFNTSNFSKECFWDFGDGETSNEQNPMHTFKTQGKNIVNLKSFDCNDEDSFSKIIDVISSIEEFNNEFTFSPNPVRDVMYMKSELTEPLSIEIFALNGEKVYQTDFIGDFELNLGYLTSGTYVLKVFDGELLMTTKFFKY